jgi:hypothetical protein
MDTKGTLKQRVGSQRGVCVPLPDPLTILFENNVRINFRFCTFLKNPHLSFFSDSLSVSVLSRSWDFKKDFFLIRKGTRNMVLKFF